MIYRESMMQIDVNNFNTNIEGRKSVLQEYYARYLTKVRGSSESTVKHYLNALNSISRRLKEKNFVSVDIYEIMDMQTLSEARDLLYEDPDFVELNNRGKRMYSAGLNNYYRFASGEGFTEINAGDGVSKKMELMDIPITPEKPHIVERIEWSRSNILREQALMFAGYACEIDQSHESFIAEKTKKAYMEGHHAIPMNNQPKFDNSLDIYANIVCLCPVCHRRIHYGIKTDRKCMMYKLYENRAERLANSGIRLSKEEFAEYA